LKVNASIFIKAGAKLLFVVEKAKENLSRGYGKYIKTFIY
jgi:hypothetical protein